MAIVKLVCFGSCDMRDLDLCVLLYRVRSVGKVCEDASCYAAQNALGTELNDPTNSNHSTRLWETFCQQCQVKTVSVLCRKAQN